jgi:hypothetical protein
MENHPDESRFEELDERRVWLNGEQVITLYREIGKAGLYVLTQNLAIPDDYFVTKVPEKVDYKEVMRKPWEWRTK